MAFTNMFKGVGGKGDGTESPAVGTSQFTSLLAGTNQFFSSVQSKKDDLLSDLSSKLTSIKLSSTDTFNQTSKKGVKDRKVRDSDEDDSSASEYGNDGDQPMYAEEAPEERRLSSESIDSLPETEASVFRRDISEFVSMILRSTNPSAEFDGREGKFKKYITHHTGRSAFAKELNKQTEQIKEVSDPVMQRLIKQCGLVLQQCNSSEDFVPASSVLAASFRIFTQTVAADGRCTQNYLYSGLRSQSIWQSMRFWNAAIFTALQQDRSLRKKTVSPVTESEQGTQEELDDNITFNQLSKFVWRIYSLGLSKEICLEFLRRQVAEASLSKKKQRFLRSNVEKFYSE